MRIEELRQNMTYGISLGILRAHMMGKRIVIAVPLIAAICRATRLQPEDLGYVPYMYTHNGIVQSFRAERGISIRHMATVLGVSKSSACNFECSGYKIPWDVYVRMCAEVGMPEQFGNFHMETMRLTNGAVPYTVVRALRWA